MRSFIRCCLFLLLSAACPAMAAAGGPDTWFSVGVAKVDVTPTHPVVLAGYGSRTTEHEGVDSKIWARALAIGEQTPLLLLAVENCGVPAPMVEEVAERLKEKANVERNALAVCSTHTHSAPSLVGYASVLWQGRLTPDGQHRAQQYTQWLTDRLVDVAFKAIEARQPAKLAWNQGIVTFGGNRRVLKNGQWAGFGLQPDGPVDHSMPVLVATGRDGKTIAIWTNYACHCTTLGAGNRISGDWAGFASQMIEENHPDAVALTTIGCGADIGPQPSGNAEIARRHGQSIAIEVERLLPDVKPLSAPPQPAMRTVKLPLGDIPSREEWEQRAAGGGFAGQHAQLMLKRLDRDGQLSQHVDYPVTVWAFGDDLAIVFLPGEVCVDYAVRLKMDLDWNRLWINAWSNDVPCYIPSRRILQEGGYEADFSMIYYGQPSRFAAEVEDVLVSNVKELIPKALARTDSKRPSFLRRPTSQEVFHRRVGTWFQSASDEERRFLRELLPLAAQSQCGFAELVDNDGGEDSWYDYSGTKSRRPFVRQLKIGDTLRWSTATVQLNPDTKRHVFVFLGGIGWQSQPMTDGFALLIGEREVLKFNVTRNPQRWQSADEKAVLHYVPTWTSNEDSGGFFYLVVDSSLLTDGQACSLAVCSQGSGSQRWFSVDTVVDVKPIERLLIDAVTELETADGKGDR